MGMQPALTSRRKSSPPRVTERDVERGLARSAGSIPTTVLSLWQPLASMLAHGIQRIEGRGWATAFRGRLWIHAGSKVVSQEDIARWEILYREIHAQDGNPNLQLPESYPTSALVGMVEVVDVIGADAFDAWPNVPRGLRREGRAHGSGFLFLVERHQRLPVPLKMSGQHKLWRVDRQTAQRAHVGLIDSEQDPVVRFSCIRPSSPDGPLARNDPVANVYFGDNFTSDTHSVGGGSDSAGECDDDTDEDLGIREAIRRSLLEPTSDVSQTESSYSASPTCPTDMHPARGRWRKQHDPLASAHEHTADAAPKCSRWRRGGTQDA